MSNRDFDPGGVGVHNGNYFGFPWSPDEAPLVLMNVPWDSTTSYRRGTADGPSAMIRASTQLDFYSFDNPGASITQCGTDRLLEEQVLQLNEKASPLSKQVIDSLEAGTEADDTVVVARTTEVNRISAEVDSLIYNRCLYWLRKGKRILLVGGEHSVPLGYLRALKEISPHGLGLLHVDAHADLRVAYEGFTGSHASIMYNVLKENLVEKIVQVGIRDVSHEEMLLAEKDPRIAMFSEHNINQSLYSGCTWFEKCREIVAHLPNKVYISFDIDGLSPLYCPNTGTPVPGSLTPDAVFYLITMVAESGRQIVGADLCEVSPGQDEWDASVGARVLYRLATLMQHSHHPTTA